MKTLLISPHDPLIARDGRPFGQGEGTNRMHCLDWPYPSLTAGSLRTLAGKLYADGKMPDFDDDLVKTLKEITIRGPLPYVRNQLYFPAPLDLQVYENTSGRHKMVMRPASLENGEGCNLPDGLLPVAVTEDIKPAAAPAFWSLERMTAWLAADDPKGFPIPGDGHGFLVAFPKDERVHVKILPETFVAEEGNLFSTESICISDAQGKGSAVDLAISVDTSHTKIARCLENLSSFHPVGGERRLSQFRSLPESQGRELWRCPQEIGVALQSAEYVRMVLATPAIFESGWLPKWLDGNFTGTPHASGVKLRLKSACVGRWRPLSGWSLEKATRGPKALRRLVPAGSVYFFKVVSGDASSLKDSWLKPVCDIEQDRHDGFGLAMWGVWNGKNLNEREAVS